jgi:hypothetical protein
MAAITILVGAIVIAFSPARWDRVIIVLPRGHGIHLHDVIGMTFVALGTTVLFRLSSR